MAFFHAWLETLERLTPPKYAVFGLPVSSRLILLGGDGLEDVDIDELGLFHNMSFLGHFPHQLFFRRAGIDAGLGL